jgi:hypothetical protein
MPVQLAADEVPVEELARRRGVRPVESADEMARPGLLDSHEEWEESWLAFTLPGVQAWRELMGLEPRTGGL